MLSLTGNPMDGGIMLCPVPGCQCFSTWSPGHPDMEPVIPEVPDEAEVQRLRELVQSSE